MKRKIPQKLEGEVLALLREANIELLLAGRVIRKLDENGDYSEQWTMDGNYVPCGPQQNIEALLDKLGVKPACGCEIGIEWSGSARPDDSGWECDDCGRFIPVEEE